MTTQPGISRLFQWLAGGEEKVLSLVESERDFFTALGMVAAAMAVASGFTLSVAASGWWTVPIQHVLWIGAAWTVLILLIERLVLKSFGTSRRWNLAISCPRVLLSLAIALVFALPIVQFIYRPSINRELGAIQSAQIKTATKNATAFFGPKIAAAKAQTQVIQGKERALNGQWINYTKLGGCESNEPSCSQTHEAGCGNICRADMSNAQLARATLIADRPKDAAEIAKLQRNIAIWQNAEQSEITSRTNAIVNDTDLLARQEALQAIEKKHPAVSKYVDFVLLFFIALDLVPLTMKLSHLFSTGGPYEQAAAALRARDLVDVHQLNHDTATRRHRATEQARADQEVDRFRIGVDRDAAITEQEARWWGLVGDGPNDSPAPTT